MLRAGGGLGGFRGGHLSRLAVARAQPELLLDLQVRKTPHRLRGHRAERLLDALEVAVHDLLLELLKQLLELLARLWVHEIVVAERLDLAADVRGELVELV